MKRTIYQMLITIGITLIAYLGSQLWISRYEQLASTLEFHIPPSLSELVETRCNMAEGFHIWPDMSADFDRPAPIKNYCYHADDAMKVIRQKHDEYTDQTLYAILTVEILRPSNVPDSFRNLADIKRRQQEHFSFLHLCQAQDPMNALYDWRLADAHLSSLVKRKLLGKKVNLTSPVKHILSEPRQKDANLSTIDGSRLKQAVSEYRSALKHVIQLHYFDKLRPTYEKLTAPVMTEHYGWRAHIATCYDHYLFFDDRSLIYPVARHLAKTGDAPAAHALLDMPSILQMIMSDPQATSDRRFTAWRYLVDASATEWDIAKEAKRPQDMRYYQRVNRQLVVFLQKIPYQWEFWPNHLTVNLTAQSVWANINVLLVCAMLVSFASQLFWLVFRLLKRIPVTPSIGLRASVRTAVVTALAGLIFTMALLVIAPGPSQLNSWVMMAAYYVIIAMMVSGWVIFRHQFKRQCEHMGVEIPDRWTEAVFNWVPALCVVGVWAALNYNRNYRVFTWDAYGVYALMIVVCLLLLAPVVLTKWRYSHYYAEASRQTNCLLAVMAVTISIGVMPLLMVQEVMLLRRDHTGLGAYQSAELLQAREQALNRQFVQQVQRILREAER
ncbi:MAG: hypothetical protein ACYC1M_13595 [Armatimonadota bacterium]